MALSQGSWSPASGMRENWLVQIDDSSGSNKKYYSFFDQTVNSVAYSGRILNKPSIRESINLFGSTSTTSNLSLEIDNSDETTDTLLFGTNVYLNREVRVYSCLESGTVANFNNIPLIYTGRLESMTHNESSVSLNVVAKMPWDNVSIPNVYSAEKILAPIAYGDFTGNDSLIPGSGTDNWRPAPITKATGASAFFVVGTIADGTLDSKTSQYVPTRDGFVPFETQSSGTSTIGSVETITVGVNGKYKYYTVPTANAQNSTATGITETNVSNAYDSNTGTFATFAYSETISTGQDRYHVERFTIPETEAGTEIVLTYRIASYSKATDVELLEVTPTLEAGINTVTGTAHSANTGSDQTLTLVTTTDHTTVDLKIRYQTEEAEDTSGGAAAVNLNVYELSVSNIKNDEKLKQVFVAVDGFPSNSSWSGNTNTLTELHEFHRDICHRFLGLTATPINWSDLDGAKDWQGRLWEHKKKPIKAVLNQLAFEGGFCYTFSAAGVLKYIFVKDSYSSADHTLDKNDLRGITISHTPISNMIMDMTVNYNKHPAKDEFRSQVTDSDSTLRTNYNIGSTEQKHVFDLDYLTTGQGSDLDCSSASPNDGFMDYYGSLLVSPRILIKAQIVNPAKFNMELGDICTFSSMPTAKAFNKTFTASGDKYYMITSISRVSGSIDCEFTNVTPGEQ
tara:strand:- start:356 stop:2398 length:2043 start_codon:yes stop_codon:yes gene_type:complete